MENPFQIDKISLVDFKNYASLHLNFESDFVGLVGENGAGKTNILDAIYYICTSKSYFNSTEQYNFRHDCQGMLLQAALRKEGRDYKISMKIQKGKKKEILINQVREDKAIEYVGKFPVVMIAPDDNMIILGASEERRKMMDNILCQSDVTYTELLVQYNKILANRNALLKQFSESHQYTYDLLDTYDLMLSRAAEQIFLRRKIFVEKFSKEFELIYNNICQEKESIEVIYKSHLLQGELQDMLRAQRSKDILLQRTTRGIHLDDLELMLNGYPIKKIGSQGQQKTFVVSMKLSLYHLLADRKKISPILLLDDIFEKFDDSRVSQLFKILSEMHQGQVFVSDTNEDRIKRVMNMTGKKYEIYQVNEGNVEKKNSGSQIQ